MSFLNVSTLFSALLLLVCAEGRKKAIKFFLMNIEKREKRNRAGTKSLWFVSWPDFFQLFSIIVRPDIELLWHKYWTARKLFFSVRALIINGWAPFVMNEDFYFKLQVFYCAIIRKVADIRGQKRSFPLSLIVFFPGSNENCSFPTNFLANENRAQAKTFRPRKQMNFPEDIITGFSINLLCGDNIGV